MCITERHLCVYHPRPPGMIKKPFSFIFGPALYVKSFEMTVVDWCYTNKI